MSDSIAIAELAPSYHYLAEKVLPLKPIQARNALLAELVYGGRFCRDEYERDGLFLFQEPVDGDYEDLPDFSRGVALCDLLTWARKQSWWGAFKNEVAGGVMAVGLLPEVLLDDTVAARSIVGFLDKTEIWL